MEVKPESETLSQVLSSYECHPTIGNKYIILLDEKPSVVVFKPYVKPPLYKRFVSSAANGLRFPLQVVKYAIIGWVAVLCSVLVISLIWYSLYAAAKYIITQFGLQ